MLSSTECARPEALQRTVVQAERGLSSPCLVSPLGAFCHLPLLLPWILQIDGGSEWRRGPCYPTHSQCNNSSMLPHSSPIQQTALLPAPQVPSSFLPSPHSAPHTSSHSSPPRALAQILPRSVMLDFTQKGRGLTPGPCNRRYLQQVSMLISVQERLGKRGWVIRGRRGVPILGSRGRN